MGKIRLYYNEADGKFYQKGQEPGPEPKVHVIPDEMGERLEHPQDGKYYSSKSQFSAATKRCGGIEVGNENQRALLKPEDKRPPMQESIKEAFEFHRTVEGKSEGERREIEARFFGQPLDYD